MFGTRKNLGSLRSKVRIFILESQLQKNKTQVESVQFGKTLVDQNFMGLRALWISSPCGLCLFIYSFDYLHDLL